MHVFLVTMSDSFLMEKVDPAKNMWPAANLPKTAYVATQSTRNTVAEHVVSISHKTTRCLRCDHVCFFFFAFVYLI